MTSDKLRLTGYIETPGEGISCETWVAGTDWTMIKHSTLRVYTAGFWTW